MDTELIKKYAKKAGFNQWDVFELENTEYVIFHYVDENGNDVPFGLPHICYENGGDLVLCDFKRAFEILKNLKDTD